MTRLPPGAELSFQQLVNALMYKSKYARDQLEELSDAELDTLNRKLHILAGSVRGHRNALQKINRLPPELLLTILSHAQAQTQTHLSSFLPDISAYEDHGREWFTIAHVCRLWRGVVARAPVMWATVDNTVVDDDDDAVGFGGLGSGSGKGKGGKGKGSKDRYLSRSGAAPLTVYLGVKDLPIRRKQLEPLLKHVARFKELHLAADLWEGSSTPIYTFFIDPAPQLTSLSIRTEGKDIFGGGGVGVLPPIFGGERGMPALRHLALEHFTSWPTNYFSNLTALCLSDQAFNRPTTASFLDFLENSPLLETLALVRAGPTLPPTTDVSPAPSANRVLKFRHMRQLSIGGWPTTATVSRFLSHLEIPGEAEVYIWGSVFSNPDTDLEGLWPGDTSRLRNVEGVKRWYLTHYSVAQPGDLLYVPFTALVGSNSGSGSGSGSTSGGDESDGGALHNYGVFRAEKLLASLPRYPLHNITSFVLRDSSYQANRFTTPVWREIFGRMRSLERLRILAYQSTTTTRSVLMALLPGGWEGRAGGWEGRGRGKDKTRVSVGAEAGAGKGGEGKNGSGSGSGTAGRREGGVLTGDDDDVDVDDLVGPESDLSPVLCPKLTALGIEHDPDLAAIFITKLAKARKQRGSPLVSLHVLVFDPQYGSGPARRRRHSRMSSDRDPDGDGDGEDGGSSDNDDDDDGSSVSSRDILNEEYRMRSREDEELLRRYVRNVRFEYKKPLSQDLVPKGWPTDAYRRTCLPYSF